MDAVTIIEFDLTQRKLKRLTLDELSIDLNDATKVYWIHSDLTHTDSFNQVAAKLQLLDDLLKLSREADPMPKCIDREDALIIQIQCLLDETINIMKLTSPT